MKIAMIGHKRLPSREGGIEVVVTELATRLVKRGHQVDAYNRWEPFNEHILVMEDGTPPPTDEYEGVRLHQIITSQKSSLNAFLYSFFATIVVAFQTFFQRKFDVVHLHAEGICAFIWLFRLLGIPTVVTIHGLDWKRAKWGKFASWYLRFAERMAATFADEIIVLSKDMQRYFRYTYGRETTYLNNGLTVHIAEPVNRIRKLGLDHNEYFLYLGRIVPEKGIHYLIDAFYKLDPDVKLVIAGDMNTPYGETLRERVAGDERIIFPGFVQGDLLAELYSHCIAYILPSDVEGMAITMLEAMSYGAPCILSDIPENTEVAGGYAHCFPRGNVSALAECLRDAIEHRGSAKTAEISIRGMEYIRTYYGWDHVLDETIRCYERAAAQHRRWKGRA